jgi:hypothetical protein
MYYAAKCTLISSVAAISSFPRIAKKEDDPEQALKEFKAIVEKEEEKGDWYTIFSQCSPQMTDCAGTGGSRRSNSRQSYFSWSSNDQTRPLRHIVDC